MIFANVIADFYCCMDKALMAFFFFLDIMTKIKLIVQRALATRQKNVML